MAKIIAVCNQKGGVGKTTSVVELAYQAGSVLGKKVLVVDLDPQGNATDLLLGTTSRPNIFDLLVEEYWLDLPKKLIKTALPVWRNVSVIPGDARLGGVEAHLSVKISKESILKGLLQPLLSAVDVILLDLPPTANILTFNALVAADSYLVPTDLSTLSRAGVANTKRLAEVIRDKGLNPGLKFEGVLVTGYQKGGSHAVLGIMEDLTAEYGTDLLPMKIWDSTRVLEAQKARCPVAQIDPDCRVVSEYAQVAKLIMEAH